MRHVLAIALLAIVLAMHFFERDRPNSDVGAPAPERSLGVAPRPSATNAVAIERPPAVEPLPRLTATKLRAIEQPIVSDVGFVVDRDAVGWLPRSFLLREGDAVLEVDGEPVTSTRQVADAVRGVSEGSAVQLHVRLLRGGTTTYWVGN